MWSVTDSRDATEPIWTAREVQVLDSIARGLTNGQIASDLGISFATAKWHVSEVITKLGVASREEVAAYWKWRSSFRGRMHRVLAPLAGLAATRAAGAAAAGVAGVGIVLAVQVAGFPVTGSSDESRHEAPAPVTTPRGRDLIGVLPTPAPPMDARGCPTVSSTGLRGLLCSYQKYPAVAALDKGGCDLSGTSVAGNLAHIDLSGCDLRGASLRGAMLNGASLANADLTGADLSGASLGEADLAGAVLRDIVATPGVFSGANFDRADLTGARLEGAILGGGSWEGAICPDGLPADTRGGTCIGTPGLEDPPTTYEGATPTGR